MAFFDRFRKGLIKTNFNLQFNNYASKRMSEYSGAVGEDVFISYYKSVKNLINVAKKGHSIKRLQIYIDSANKAFEQIRNFMGNSYQFKKTLNAKQCNYFTRSFNAAQVLNINVNKRTKKSAKTKLKYKKFQRFLEEKNEEYKFIIDGKKFK